MQYQPNKHRIYNFNLQDVVYLPTSTDYFIHDSFQHGKKFICEYLRKQQRGIRSYYSPRTIRVLIDRLARQCALSYETHLCTIVYGYYLDICLEEEMDMLLEYVRLDSFVPSEDALFTWFNRNLFYYETLSYEFIERYYHYIEPYYLKKYVPLSYTLVERYPELLMTDVNFNQEFKWRVDQHAVATVVMHKSTHADADEHAYPILDVADQLMQYTYQTQLHQYELYEFSEEIVRKYHTYIDLAFMFEVQHNHSTYVIQRFFNMYSHDHNSLLRQRHITSELVEQLCQTHALDLIAASNHLQNTLFARHDMQRLVMQDCTLQQILTHFYALLGKTDAIKHTVGLCCSDDTCNSICYYCIYKLVYGVLSTQRGDLDEFLIIRHLKEPLQQLLHYQLQLQQRSYVEF
jgi:hypothetical protein